MLPILRSVLHGLILLCGLVASAGIASANSYRWLSIEGRPVRWFTHRAEPIVLKYAVVTSEVVTANAINCGRIEPPAELMRRSSLTDAEFGRAVDKAFRLWQQHVAIEFVEVADQRTADIVIGQQVDPTGYAFANVTVDQTNVGHVGRINKAAICFNPLRVWKIGYDGNLAVYDLVHALVHEIGHAIGLDHPPGRGNIMSFKYTEDSNGLSIGDIRGAEELYGRRMRDQNQNDTAPAPVAPATNVPAPRTDLVGTVTSQFGAGP